MSIPLKEKPCKGTGQAHGYGCGKLTMHRQYGLGKMCCYAKWLFTSEAGKVKLSKALSTASKITRSKTKAADKLTRDKLKTLSQYEADAKKSFQKFIRLRDKDLPCISCDNPTNDLWDGGHYKKAEIYSGVIFDEMNCNKQCRKCNRFLGGNELNYREGMIRRFGVDYVLEVEKKALESRQYKYSKEELISIKKMYDDKIKQLR